MLLCPTVEVRQSKIHGLGLFATTRIAAGTLVLGWRAEKDFRITPTEWSALPDNLRKFLYVYCWVGPGGDWYGTHDGARFTNHSRTPNIRWSDDLMSSVALRDIAAGEEITEDYEDFDGAFAQYASELVGPAPEPVKPTCPCDSGGGGTVCLEPLPAGESVCLYCQDVCKYPGARTPAATPEPVKPATCEVWCGEDGARLCADLHPGRPCYPALGHYCSPQCSARSPTQARTPAAGTAPKGEK